MTLTELQEIAMRQQQQIEINQQLLHAKEKRLKALKIEETRHQQASTTAAAAHSQQHHQTSGEKLDALKESVMSQELKIFKLKQLRNQILEYKLSNSNMYSELDLIKSLFEQKERELFAAASKCAELSKQIEQLRKLKQKNNPTTTTAAAAAGGGGPMQDQQQAAVNSHITELERLKQELQIRNKLNEQQSKKIVAQQESFNKKQLEVLALDKRIEELKDRIASKRNYLMNNQFNPNACAAARVINPSPVNNVEIIHHQQQQQQQQQLNQRYELKHFYHQSINIEKS
jgi:hypothetical protein